jgi:tRNA(Ile)-lysidine synthetase-like protein
VRIPELRQKLTITPRRIEPWMTRGDSRRAGFHCPGLEGRRLVVRNRRPGDRIRPLGRGRERRLKDVLIDHRIPRELRDRIPLLVIDEDIVWVPGVTIGEAFRLHHGATEAWVASLEDHRTPADFARSAAPAAPR